MEYQQQQQAMYQNWLKQQQEAYRKQQAEQARADYMKQMQDAQNAWTKQQQEFAKRQKELQMAQPMNALPQGVEEPPYGGQANIETGGSWQDAVFGLMGDYLPYYDNPIAKGFAQGLREVNPELYGLQTEWQPPAPERNSRWGVYDPYGIYGEDPSAYWRRMPSGDKYRNLQDLFEYFAYGQWNEQPSYAVQQEETPAPEYPTGDGGGYSYPNYSYPGYSYPNYSYPDYEYAEPAKSWYESMLQWNID
jgi:hypothetical protein